MAGKISIATLALLIFLIGLCIVFFQNRCGAMKSRYIPQAGSVTDPRRSFYKFFWLSQVDRKKMCTKIAIISNDANQENNLSPAFEFSSTPCCVASCT